MNFTPTLTVTKFDKQIAEYKFTTEAQAIVKRIELCKEQGLKRQRGFWGNAKTGIELSQNF